MRETERGRERDREILQTKRERARQIYKQRKREVGGRLKKLNESRIRTK